MLAEECAEVIQAKSKLIRYGLNHINPLKGHNAIHDLEMELGDILALVDILVENNTVSAVNLENHKQDKFKRLEKWYCPDLCVHDPKTFGDTE